MDTYYFYTEGLTVGYHGVPLIKDIRISLKKGEILTLIGPNGAGKTTILKSIIRQLAPLGGVAVLDGKAMGDLSGKELSQKLSVVLTERIHPEMMTCRDVVSTGRYPYTGKFGVLSGEDWAVVDEAMDLVHIHGAGRSGLYEDQRRPEAAGHAGPGALPAAGYYCAGRAHFISGYPLQTGIPFHYSKYVTDKKSVCHHVLT